MEEKITLCGDNCLQCPRYIAHTEMELRAAAELWHKIGWRDTVVSNEEIRCEGCFPGKSCTYHLSECAASHGVEKCRKCDQFPCGTVSAMLERSRAYQKECEEVCSAQEYAQLEKAFFRKEHNLKKIKMHGRD